MGRLARDPAWSNAFLERATHMVARDFSTTLHLIIWSLGNGSRVASGPRCHVGWIKRSGQSKSAVQVRGAGPIPPATDICPMYAEPIRISPSRR